MSPPAAVASASAPPVSSGERATRLIAVGDLHGEIGSLFRLLDRLEADTAAPPLSGLLCVGDWGDPNQIASADWDRLLARLPVRTVFGNHDDLPFLTSLCNRDRSPILLPQGEHAEFCGLALAGVSGIWAKSHRQPFYVTDEDVACWAEHLAARSPAESPLDILLTHGCPLGIADRTPSGRPGGQRCFLDLLKTARPRLHLCGHLHVAQQRLLQNLSFDPPCTVINTGPLPVGHYVDITHNPNGHQLAAALRHISLDALSAA